MYPPYPLLSHTHKLSFEFFPQKLRKKYIKKHLSWVTRLSFFYVIHLSTHPSKIYLFIEKSIYIFFIRDSINILVSTYLSIKTYIMYMCHWYKWNNKINSELDHITVNDFTISPFASNFATMYTYQFWQVEVSHVKTVSINTKLFSSLMILLWTAK